MVHKDEYQPVPYTPNAYDGNVPVSGGAMGSPPMVQQQKLYDPNDPSTFPSSPFPETFNSSYSAPQYSAHTTNTAYTPGLNGNNGRAAGYTGVAEV